MIRRFLAMIALPLVLFACNNGHKQVLPDSKEIAASEQKTTPGMIAVTDTVVSGAADPSPASPVAAPAIEIDKKIIKDATIKMEVNDFAGYSRKIRDLIKKYGAYIAKEENSDTEEMKEALLLIRVPVMYFEDLLNELPDAAAKQLERSITSEEVSGQLVDTKARLLTKKQTRDKYLEFLKQARSTEDVLKIQREVNDLQEEIESAESRLGYLFNQTRYSTLHLFVIEPKSGYRYNDQPGLGRKLANAVKSGGAWFTELLIGWLSIWPLWVFGTGVVIMVRKTRWHRKLKNG